MTVKFRDYRDFVIWFDAWTEDKKKLTSAELERLREAVHSIPLAPTAAPAPKLATSTDPAKPRPVMSGGVAMSAGP
jgi:hypothetical protein